MSIEALTNILPHSVDLEYSGTSIAELTQSEWAAILAGCTDQEWNLAMLMYCGEDCKAPLLARFLLTLPIPFKNKKVPIERLTSAQNKVIRQLSRLCVSEYAENSLCMVCRGEKQVYTQTCPACHGSGYRNLTDCDREQLSGMKRGTWRDYEPVYQRYMVKLSAMDTSNKIRYREFVETDLTQCDM